MTWFGFVTLFPELIEAGFASGVVGRARSQGQIEVATFNPRDYTQDKHRTVDDRPYGGGAGMVMMYEPLRDAIQAAKSKAPAQTPVILMSPQGEQVNQQLLSEFAIGEQAPEGVIIVCGRYEGLDQRLIDSVVDFEWSVGDYVLSGGELPALVACDAMIRLIPGVLGNNMSIIDESFLDDQLDYPHYTRPEQIDENRVPAALLSGNHREIADFRRREALTKTYVRRPDLLTQKVFSDSELKLLRANLIR